jgi:hypothetical protein
LGFSARVLYLVPQYLANKPVYLLIAPELAADDFSDDTLGRSLDQLYVTGVTPYINFCPRGAGCQTTCQSSAKRR